MRAIGSRPEPAECPGPESEEERARRLERIRTWKLDTPRPADLVARLRSWDRERLEAEGLLLDPPRKGGLLVPARCRPIPLGGGRGAAARGEGPAVRAAVRRRRRRGAAAPRGRELPTLTVPRAKAHAVAFPMRAATEIGAVGAWRDPQRQADDERAPDVLVQVEYGEVAEEPVGNGIAASLKPVNDLEVNEQVLYARMENVEESTLE